VRASIPHRHGDLDRISLDQERGVTAIIARVVFWAYLLGRIMTWSAALNAALQVRWTRC
jgi:hypothetical protein